MNRVIADLPLEKKKNSSSGPNGITHLKFFQEGPGKVTEHRAQFFDLLEYLIELSLTRLTHFGPTFGTKALRGLFELNFEPY